MGIDTPQCLPRMDIVGWLFLRQVWGLWHGTYSFLVLFCAAVANVATASGLNIIEEALRVISNHRV